MFLRTERKQVQKHLIQLDCNRISAFLVPPGEAPPWQAWLELEHSMLASWWLQHLQDPEASKHARVLAPKFTKCVWHIAQ